MRVEPTQHALLTKAAAILHKDRSAFILDIACREAENVLLDQRLFQLNNEEFDAFDAFDAFDVPLSVPLIEIAKLKSLLKKPSP
jgi:uncharacterized protein (DUF1778 family)